MRGSVILVSLGVCLAVVGCRRPLELRTRPGSSVNFAVMPERLPYSLLNVIQESGSLTVCVGTPDSDGASAQSIRARIESLVRRVIGDWNALLSGHPTWPVQGAVDVTFEYRPHCQEYTIKPSEADWPKLKIDVFDRHENYAAHVCEPDDLAASDPLCRSTASPEWRALWLDGDRVSQAEVAHEYGHMLGLGAAVETRPEDDKAGLWAIATFLKTGRMECGPGRVAKTEVQANVLQSLVCAHASDQP